MSPNLFLHLIPSPVYHLLLPPTQPPSPAHHFKKLPLPHPPAEPHSPEWRDLHHSRSKPAPPSLWPLNHHQKVSTKIIGTFHYSMTFIITYPRGDVHGTHVLGYLCLRLSYQKLPKCMGIDTSDTLDMLDPKTLIDRGTDKTRC